jgi:hypothetical protein
MHMREEIVKVIERIENDWGNREAQSRRMHTDNENIVALQVGFTLELKSFGFLVCLESHSTVDGHESRRYNVFTITI